MYITVTGLCAYLCVRHI